MIFSRCVSRERGRERGNIVVLSFLLVSLLAALATAHFVTVQKNSRQSVFFNAHGELRRYAEGGIHMGLYELTYKVGKSDGNIGTELWTAAADVGRDGTAGTKDEGEGDGIPTPGEPSLVAASCGLPSEGTGLLVRSTDTIWPNVKRIVSTAFNQNAIATSEVYARQSFNTMPPTAAIFVQPGVNLDINGNAFRVNGNDTNPDGKPVPGSKVIGIATSVGSPAGSNSTAITDQIPANRQKNISGTGGTPSVAETSTVNFDQVWDWFMAAPKTTVAPGGYSNAVWGSEAAKDYKVTYCKGDVDLSGSSIGAGCLIVEGNLTMSGKSSFVGVVLVKGDVILTGGGSGIHIYGSLLMGSSPTNPKPTLTIEGTSDVVFSSLALANASKLIPPFFTILYWNDLK